MTTNPRNWAHASYHSNLHTSAEILSFRRHDSGLLIVTSSSVEHFSSSGTLICIYPICFPQYVETVTVLRNNDQIIDESRSITLQKKESQTKEQNPNSIDSVRFLETDSLLVVILTGKKVRFFDPKISGFRSLVLEGESGLSIESFGSTLFILQSEFLILYNAQKESEGPLRLFPQFRLSLKSQIPSSIFSLEVERSGEAFYLLSQPKFSFTGRCSISTYDMQRLKGGAVTRVFFDENEKICQFAISPKKDVIVIRTLGSKLKFSDAIRCSPISELDEAVCHYSIKAFNFSEKGDFLFARDLKAILIFSMQKGLQLANRISFQMMGDPQRFRFIENDSDSLVVNARNDLCFFK